MDFKISSLKTLMLLHFRRPTSNLFDSIMVDGKKCLKKLCLVLKQGILSQFLSE